MNLRFIWAKAWNSFFHMIKSKRAMYARREYTPYVHSCVKDMNIFNSIIWYNRWQTEEDNVARRKKTTSFGWYSIFFEFFLFLFALRLHGKLSHSYRIFAHYAKLCCTRSVKPFNLPESLSFFFIENKSTSPILKNVVWIICCQ